MMQAIKNFLRDESGMGTIEMVLLILILIGLALAFKSSIATFFGKLTSGFNNVNASNLTNLNSK
jgi:Flp pilus assembly pilin Flp